MLEIVASAWDGYGALTIEQHEQRRDEICGLQNKTKRKAGRRIYRVDFLSVNKTTREEAVWRTAFFVLELLQVRKQHQNSLD